MHEPNQTPPITTLAGNGKRKRIGGPGSTPYGMALRMQRLLLNDAEKHETGPETRVLLARAFIELEKNKRMIRGLVKPGSPRRKRTESVALDSFAAEHSAGHEPEPDLDPIEELRRTTEANRAHAPNMRETRKESL